LAVAAILAWLGGTPALSLAVLAVILLNAGFAFVQEVQAEHAVEALAAFLPATAVVVRDGARCQIPARDLVPGDVLIVTEGDRVSADARIIAGEVLISMSGLTGESSSVSRFAEPASTTGALLEAQELVFSGTTCTGGEASTVVTRTGMHTEIGRIAALSQRGKAERSPLERHVRRATVIISVVAVAVGAAFLPAGLAAGRDSTRCAGAVGSPRAGDEQLRRCRDRGGHRRSERTSGHGDGRGLRTLAGPDLRTWRLGGRRRFGCGSGCSGHQRRNGHASHGRRTGSASGGCLDGGADEDEAVGVVLVCRSSTDEAYDQTDLVMITSLAAQAGVAIQLAQSRENRELLSLLMDREQIAEDLRHRVIHRLFTLGISLQAAVPRIVHEVPRAAVTAGIDELDAVIREIRGLLTAFPAKRTSDGFLSMIAGDVLIRVLAEGSQPTAATAPTRSCPSSTVPCGQTRRLTRPSDRVRLRPLGSPDFVTTCRADGTAATGRRAPRAPPESLDRAQFAAQLMLLATPGRCRGSRATARNPLPHPR
jgi:hypothetical protein